MFVIKHIKKKSNEKTQKPAMCTLLTVQKDT